MEKFINKAKGFLRVQMKLLKIKCKLFPGMMTQKYLKEWHQEMEYASEHCKEPNFSWHWHDKELLSIQGAIRSCYRRACAKRWNFLTNEEKTEVEKILNCFID